MVVEADEVESAVVLPVSRKDRARDLTVAGSSRANTAASANHVSANNSFLANHTLPFSSSIAHIVIKPKMTIDDLPSVPVIPKESLKEREEKREKDTVEFELFRKSWEKRRDEDKIQNEERKTELRIELEKKRKEFTEMQMEESKKRELYNKKNFPELEHSNESSGSVVKPMTTLESKKPENRAKPKVTQFAPNVKG